MIFINNQLMPTENELQLFMVSNPVPFENFEDHEAGIYIRLIELIDQAKKEGEDPKKLIEDYLQIDCNIGQQLEDYAEQIFLTDEMKGALHELNQNWNQVDDSLPGESLVYGGLPREEAIHIYAQTTLRSYLETLANTNND